MHQLDLFTSAPINADRLSGQNRRLFDYLEAGNTIHCFHPAVRELRIGYLNSRCADITRFLRGHGKELYRRFIKVRDVNGELVAVREYSFYPF